MKSLLQDKIALVTGGSSGIGRAAAIALAREGATVVVADVDVERAEATLDAARAAGAQMAFLEADVSRNEDVEAVLHWIVNEHGRLDCAFNNAGILEGIFTTAVDCPEETWDRVIRVNLKGVWLCMKHEISQMLRQGGGVIVNHASVAGLYGNRIVGPAYIASKHGVVGLTRAAALEHASMGIRINAICPGIVEDTVMSEAIFGGDPHMESRIRALYPAGRVGRLPEVAETVVWLCSDAAPFINGHALPIDGALLAQ